MGFGVLAGGFAACENPKIPIPPPWGGGQGVGKNRDFDLVKALARVFVTYTVGDFRKLAWQGMSKALLSQLSNSRSDQHQCSLHPQPRFVSPHGATAHLHSPDSLLSTIIRPANVLIPVKDSIAIPIPAQADQQQVQLILQRARVPYAEHCHAYFFVK